MVAFVPPERHAALLDALELTLRGQQTDNLELPLLRSGGRTGHFSVNLSPMRDERGNVNSIVVVMTDITDAALLQAKLRHTEKMAALGRYVLEMHHSLNDALTSVLGNADLLLLEAERFPAEAREQLAAIHTMTLRLHEILQRFSSLASELQLAEKESQSETLAASRALVSDT